MNSSVIRVVVYQAVEDVIVSDNVAMALTSMDVVCVPLQYIYCIFLSVITECFMI